MASYILPYDPVAKKRNAGGKRDHQATISDLEGAEVSAGFGTKQGIGKTGVHLRYYKKEEYQKLSKEQQDELREWRSTTNQNGKGAGKHKGKWDPKRDAMGPKKNDKNISSLISKEISKQLKKEKGSDIDAMIMALQQGVKEAEEGPVKKKARFEEAVTKVNTSALKTILHQVKNKGSQDE
jgi:hypothetical protein